MRRSLGDKRREIPEDKRAEILRLHAAFEEEDRVKILDATRFGYRKITVERPLRLNFEASPQRIARLEDQKAFQALAASKKKDPVAKAQDEEEGRAEQRKIGDLLRALPPERFLDRGSFSRALTACLRGEDMKLAAPIRKAVLKALSERDETAEICRDHDGNPEPDPELRDTESVPLGEDINDFFEREVRPYVPDAWVDTSFRDHKDGEVGKVGYEINFNRHFYKYRPPRPLDEIEADIKVVEKEILDLLREVTS
jgi:type I restriction enzyme M protein